MFVNVADDATLKKARRSVAWYDEQEVTRVFYIVASTTCSKTSFAICISI
jgi:hypothetical protein